MDPPGSEFALALEAQAQIAVPFLPTYAPWLNPIEKVWRWLKQSVLYAHPWCDDFRELQRVPDECVTPVQ